RIELSELGNSLERTHVRFATENMRAPDNGNMTAPFWAPQPTRLKVYGRLEIVGEENEKILLTNLRSVPVSSLQYDGHSTSYDAWGGIEVLGDGVASINHAIIENAYLPLFVASTAVSS